MNNGWATALAVLVLATLSFFVFPGHTILQSDTQIYIPILEHLADPSVLTKDIMAVRPHVSFTLYDEVALALRGLTQLSFEQVLMGQQFLYRGLAIYGIYLFSSAAGLSAIAAWMVTAVVSLGAAVMGPAVLLVEYEPVPRGFALPFTILALGMVARSNWIWAAAAATIGFAFHPPTAFAFCALLTAMLVWKQRWAALAVVAIGPSLLLFAILLQTAAPERPPLFGTIDPTLEQLQRMRASYNWVDMWAGRWMPYYVALWAISLAAWRRVRRDLSPAASIFAVGLPIIGILSVPLSYLLLEEWRWVLIPQFQPGRYLLFVTLFAGLLSCLAGVKAVSQRSQAEAALFLFVPFACAAAEWDYATLLGPRLAIVLSLVFAVILSLITARPQAVVAAALLPFAVLPFFVPNYAPLHTAELDAVAAWARQNTAKDAVFQFADNGRKLEAGVFRARAERAIYADWKGGGQVNFLKPFSEIWAERWRLVSTVHPIETYRTLDIDYVVFRANNRQSGYRPVFENAEWVVYDLRNASTSFRVGIDACAPARVTESAAAAFANRSASAID